MDSLDAAVVELLSELVGIDSVNPGLVEGAAGEVAIVEALRERLQHAGFRCHVVHPEERPNRPSLIAVAPGPADAPVVVFNGHLDTVGVAGMPEPFRPRIEGNRLYGRGAADMKGGVAALVVAAEELVRRGAPMRPVLALVADEEDASLGSEALVAALPELGIRPTLCLIAEPTELAIARSLRGFGVARVRLPGRAAHSSQAELGVNALSRLGQLLHAVDTRAPELRAAGGDLMVTVASGGSSAFVVPESAECLVELRTTPDGRGAEVRELVAELLPSEWAAELELVAARDGWRLDSSGPAAELAARLGERLGTEANFDAPYWMEAPLWQALCPSVICGPSGGGLHAVDEWLDLEQLRAFTRALVEVFSTPAR